MCIRDRLKNWCNNNEVTYKENIVKENPSKVNGTYGYISVSYTHLDVYKRQLVWCAQWHISDLQCHCQLYQSSFEFVLYNH